jgi:glycosyltransferase involved in cell wall biosynthesis
MSKVLSIVIPAYNEERFVGTLLEQIRHVDLDLLGVSKQVVVVDDHSSDRTPQIVAEFPEVIFERLPANRGKGHAVRRGMALATGDYLIIQDADLEYDPQDYVPMMRALLEGRGDVIYGSRYLGRGRHEGQGMAAYLGGRSLSLVGRLCTGTWLTDTVTALKLFPRTLLPSLELTTSGFELDHEITAKVLARGLRIVEVPVSYRPRTREEGKKIGLRDWFIATRTFFRFRNG